MFTIQGWDLVLARKGWFTPTPVANSVLLCYRSKDAAQMLRTAAQRGILFEYCLGSLNVCWVPFVVVRIIFK